MANPTMKVQCWKCEHTFHLRIWEQDVDESNRVIKLVDCPYCRANCAVELSADQVARVDVYLDINQGGTTVLPPLHDLPVDALAGRVFGSRPQEKE